MSRDALRRSYRDGAAVVAVALAVAGLSGCGSKSDTGSATTQAKAIYGYIRDIVTRAKVGDPDLGPVVSAACAEYADGLRRRTGDSFTFDQYIGDLFDTQEGGLDQDRVDRGVTAACKSFDGDVRGFVDDLSSSLGIGLDELRGFVESACKGYAQRRNANPTHSDAPEAFDPLVGAVFAKGNLNRSSMASLVEGACGEFRVPVPERLAILPNHDLTPGDTSAPGDPKTWCESGYVKTYPPISAADRESVFAAYGVPADARGKYEVMRLIPPGLGGTNAKTNLFPVPRSGGPSAPDKAQIDRNLTDRVCAGSYSLETARADLVTNWPIAVAKSLAPG